MSEAEGSLERTRGTTRYFLAAAFHVPVTPHAVLRMYRDFLGQIFTPLLWMGCCLTASALAVQLGSTRLGLSLHNLTPDFKRLSPLQKLQNVPRQNASSFLQALIFLPLLALAVYKIASANLAAYAGLGRDGLQPALHIISSSFSDFMWKAAALFCAIGILDFVRVYRHHYKSLRMTKLEIRDELKETEGNPQMKQRVRRIQRDMARRNMMKEIPNATAVIVNPTHFAVAIRYDVEAMSAPRVACERQELPGAANSSNRVGPRSAYC